MTMNKAITSAILGALAVLPFASQVAAKSPELNPTTFKEAIQTKNAFIKFYAPWCGHCKSLAPTWDTLSYTFSESPAVVVGSVDCTTDDNSELCQEYGVQGYPTLKYYKDGSDEGNDYSGGRSLEELEEFVETELNKKCTVGSQEEMDKSEICTDKEKGYARKMRAKTSDEINAQIERLDKMKGGSMKPELKSWIFQRLNILIGLSSGEEGGSDEF